MSFSGSWDGGWCHSLAAAWRLNPRNFAAFSQLQRIKSACDQETQPVITAGLEKKRLDQASRFERHFPTTAVILEKHCQPFQ